MTSFNHFHQAEAPTDRFTAMQALPWQILDTLIEGRSPDRIIEMILSSVEAISGGLVGAVFLLDDTGDFMELASGPHLPPDYRELFGTGIPAGTHAGLVGAAVASREPVVIADLADDPLFAANVLGLRSCCFQPIVAANRKLLGSLALFSDHPQDPGEDELRLYKTLAHLASIAIERWRTEAARSESERYLRAVIEATPECVKMLAQDGDVLQMNAPGLRMVEADDAREVIGHSIFPLIAPEHRDDFRKFHESICRGRRGSFSYDLVGLKGGRCRVETSAVALPRADGSVVHLGITRDVTHKEQLEEQLRQAQKLEAIGTLAGGVAHDFNNLLTVINGYSDLLLQTLAEEDPTRALLSEIRRAGERSASLTRQLLAFSRKQVVVLRTLDLNAVVADTEKMLARIIGEDIRLTTVLEPSLGPVRSDPGQVEQVLLNLCANARDAMPRGGQLTIETRNVQVDDHYAATHVGVQPGPYVRLAVSDTGCGMTPDVQTHIYEPFYTTKGPGRGTGLGLSVVHGIVKQSGGHIQVYSEPGVGTTFKIYLPRIDAAVRSGGSIQGVRSMPRGSETVLLVEDDSAVRVLTAYILRECGYTLLEASNVDDALAIARGRTGPIDLLITDVVMPGGGGRLLAETVADLHPAVKVLYLSGYTDDAVVRHGILHDQVNFLQKPFSPIILTHKVREVLDPTQAGDGEPSQS